MKNYSTSNTNSRISKPNTSCHEMVDQQRWMKEGTRKNPARFWRCLHRLKWCKFKSGVYWICYVLLFGFMLYLCQSCSDGTGTQGHRCCLSEKNMLSGLHVQSGFTSDPIGFGCAKDRWSASHSFARSRLYAKLACAVGAGMAVGHLGGIALLLSQTVAL